MSKLDVIREIALDLPETTEEPHFEKTSFKVKKKIFVTHDEQKNNLSVKLSDIDQDVFTSMSKGSVYPVPNKWGQQGWTIVELETVNEELLADILKTAYCEVAPRKLADLVSKG